MKSIKEQVLEEVSNLNFQNMLDEMIPQKLIIEKAIDITEKLTRAEQTKKIFEKIEEIGYRKHNDKSWFEIGEFDMKELKKEFLK